MSALTIPRGAKAYSLRMPAAVPDLPVLRFTLAEYQRLVQIGMLTEDDQCELLEGWIIPKMPRNPPHDDAIEDIDYSVREILPKVWRIRIQSAVAVPLAESQPEPDLAVCCPRVQRRGRHPESKDTVLIVEVSDTTLRRDRGVKLRIYAKGGVPVYWIVNLNDRQVEVYTDPSGPVAKPKYRRKRIYRNGSSVPVVIAGVEVGRIPVTAMLPNA